MLVISRKQGQSFVIAEDVTVTILAVDRSGKIKIGIEAPRDVPILRSELLPATPEKVKQ